MAITVADLKFFQAERMTDNDDGGGRMTGTALVSGADNQIFDDLSDVDRAAGDVSIRKTFAAVTSADTDKYLDAGVVLFKNPADENVSVLLFSTGDYYDERAALKTRLEQTISRGGRWNGWLWGQHLEGQRALVIWQRPEAALIATGARLELVSKANGVEQHSQFLWVTRVIDNLRTIYEAYNEQTLQYTVRELICELAEPLQYDFAGLEPSRGDPATPSMGTLLYDTRYNAEAVPLFGIQPTTEAAAPTDFSIKIADLYTPVIPTALSETALPDVTPGGDSPTLVGANLGTVQFSTTTETIKPGVSLYCGTGILPGTLSISVSGATITDANGAALLSGADIGAVDYGNGVIAWNSNCPNYSTASKTITFRPAARPLRVADTAAQVVTTSNRGYVWVLTLSPIPAPGTLRVAYQVNNVWYVLTDQGTGLLRGVDSSYGSGSLNFSTGTAMITTGALPDVNSLILYTWGTPINYTVRGGDTVDAPVVRGQTTQAGVAPGSVVVEWTVGATTYTLDDDPAADGNLTGTGGVGFIRYATGEWWVRPTTLPPVNTEFSIDYDYGTPTEETFSHPVRELDGTLLLTLQAIPREHSVEVEWNLLVEDYEAEYSYEAEFIPSASRQFDPIKIVRDDGAGVLTISGGTNGTLTYASKTVQFLPDVTVSIPKPLYSKHLIGTETVISPEGSNVISTYRTLFDGYEYIPAGAQYPNDESGLVKVRYREVGGDSSASETATLEQLELDLTKGYGETLVAGSSRFTLGGSTYVDVAGQLYRDPSPATGAGALCGTLDRSTGRARITAWTAGGANSVNLQALTTELGGQPVEEVVFRTPTNPLRAGTLQLRYELLTGAAKSKTVDDTGLLSDSDCTLRVDYPLGIVRARFGLWKVDSELTPEEKLESWYDPDARVTIGGVLKIWKPTPALADSIVYNAVAQTFLPPDSALLGINAARLPVDGRALTYNVGRLVLIHHTESFTESSLSPTQVLDCERERLYRVVIEDSLGARVGADQYTVDRAAGTVTLSPSLNLTGFTAPYTIQHTVADLARLVAVDINGTLTLNKPLSHTYPAEDSRVSSVLYIGTLQARVAHVFAQSTWTSVWSDTLIGSAPLAQYNDAQYPILVSNLGAYPDRFLVQFTSSTAFRVIGENLGIIAIGDTTQDCAPLNSLTGQPYFTIQYEGWGSGWATGNCLRFNLIGACYPVDLIRATQPSEPTGTDDSIELLLVGNVDA